MSSRDGKAPTTPRAEAAKAAVYAGRMKRLDDWLLEHEARTLCSAEIRSSNARRDTRTKFSLISVAGRTLTLLVFSEYDAERHAFVETGWDLYVPPCETGDINKTLAAAERLLGFQPGKRGAA